MSASVSLRCEAQRPKAPLCPECHRMRGVRLVDLSEDDRDWYGCDRCRYVWMVAKDVAHEENQHQTADARV